MSRSTLNEQHQSQHMKTIHHTKKESGTKGFTQIDNSVLQDPNLSDRARGLLVRMLSRPDDWQFYIGHLEDTGRDSALKIRGALKELKDRGYAKLVPLLKETTMQRNGSTYQVFEDPGMSENQHAGNTARRKTHTTNNDCTKNEEKNSPNPLGESENPTTDDSPSAMGAPFSTRYSFLKKKIPGARSNSWNIASGEPAPEKDPVLVAFSQNPWGMALVRLFQIPVLKHKDARDFFTALNNESFGVDEMLWLQLIHYPENKSPVLSGFGQMIDFAKSVQWRGYGTDDAGSEFKKMEKEMDRWLVPFYLTKPEEKRQFRDEIRLEMVNVQTPALYPEFLDQIATWADHWRFFVEVRDDYSKTASYKYPNRIVRNYYAAQEDDWQAQTEDPAEPATAPASAPDCNPCSEIPDWAYDPQFRPYWQGDLPPRAETTTQDDDGDDDFPAWVLDHHAFNTAKN